jgi:hypothetical protein
VAKKFGKPILKLLDQRAEMFFVVGLAQQVLIINIIKPEKTTLITLMENQIIEKRL